MKNSVKLIALVVGLLASNQMTSRASAQTVRPIRSVQSGFYVRAGVHQDSFLAAVSPKVTPGGWEELEWINVGIRNLYVFRSKVSGKFVSVGSDGYLRTNVTSIVNGPKVDFTTFFWVWPNWEGYFYLQSAGGPWEGKYVTAGPYPLLRAAADYPSTWETFGF